MAVRDLALGRVCLIVFAGIVEVLAKSAKLLRSTQFRFAETAEFLEMINRIRGSVGGGELNRRARR